MKQDSQKNMEALNEKIEEELTEVRREISEINEKWKQSSQELQQSKVNINTRMNDVEEDHQIRIDSVRQETHDEMVRLRSNIGERCMGIELSLIHI